MKKKISLFLFIMIMIANLHAYAAVSYTLPEKMEKQLSIGSGLKGNLTVHGEGNDPLIVALDFLQDTELQLRGIKSGDDFHGYIYQEGENEARNALTELLQKDGTFFFRSDLLPGEVFSLPEAEQMADHLILPEGGNPSLASALLRMISMSSQERTAMMEPVIDKLLQELEIWVSGYAHTSESAPDSEHVSAVSLNYTIPMRELKTEIVELMMKLVQDADGQALLIKLLNAEQQEVYANQFLGYYYLDALDALDNDFDIQYTKTVSTLGQAISITLEFPLDESKTGFESLVLEEEGGLISCTLRNDDRLFVLQFPRLESLSEVDAFSIWLVSRVPGNENQDASAHALRVDFTHAQAESTDEENREHLRETWEIQAARDVTRLPEGEAAEDYPEEVPVSLKADLHFYSRYSQSSPTNLEAVLSFTRGDQSFTVTALLKTASPWTLSGFATENAKSWFALSSSEQELKIAEFLSAAMENILPPSVQSTEIPTQDSTELETAGSLTDADSDTGSGSEEMEPALAEVDESSTSALTGADESSTPDAESTSDAAEITEAAES